MVKIMPEENAWARSFVGLIPRPSERRARIVADAPHVWAQRA